MPALPGLGPMASELQAAQQSHRATSAVLSSASEHSWSRREAPVAAAASPRTAPLGPHSPAGLSGPAMSERCPKDGHEGPCRQGGGPGVSLAQRPSWQGIPPRCWGSGRITAAGPQTDGLSQHPAPRWLLVSSPIASACPQERPAGHCLAPPSPCRAPVASHVTALEVSGDSGQQHLGAPGVGKGGQAGVPTQGLPLPATPFGQIAPTL